MEKLHKCALGTSSTTNNKGVSMKSTVFEDSLRDRINIVLDKTGRMPHTLCLTAQELKFLRDEMELNHVFVAQESDEVRYEGVLIEITQLNNQ